MMLTNYRKYTDKELSDFIARNDKADIVLNGEIIETTYPSLAVYQFLNLSTEWDCKEFMGGYMSKSDYIKSWSDNKGVKVKGLLQVITGNKIIKECTL